MILDFLIRVFDEHQQHPMIYALYYVAIGGALCSPNRKAK